MQDAYAVVRRAILAREQVIATYDGHLREMCPHLIGLKNGEPQALFFQFGGTSSRGLPAGGEWRCLSVEGLEGAISRAGRWHSAANYSPSSSCVDVIDVEVGL